MEIATVVATFAARVIAFKDATAIQATAQKLARAMRGVADALGDGSLLDNNGDSLGGAQTFTQIGDYFDSLLLDASAERIDIGKLAADVETFVKYNMLDETDTVTAKSALDEWQKLGVGNGPKAQQRRAQ